MGTGRRVLAAACALAVLSACHGGGTSSLTPSSAPPGATVVFHARPWVDCHANEGDTYIQVLTTSTPPVVYVVNAATGGMRPPPAYGEAQSEVTTKARPDRRFVVPHLPPGRYRVRRSVICDLFHRSKVSGDTYSAYLTITR
jgi:hypothetical protein